MSALVLLEEVLSDCNIGYQLKEEQKEVIVNAVHGCHTFVLLPTGFGKSDCFGLVGPLLDKVSRWEC